MGRHNGRFRWKKYTKYKGNLRGYWERKDRRGDRHRKDERLNEALITQVIRRYHPEWSPPADNGREWIKTLCPFHGDSVASAGVSYRHNAFKCLACPVKGDAVALIKEQEGVGYAEAFRIAEELSSGSYGEVPREYRRQPSRRVFAEQRASVSVDPERREQVPPGIRGRSSPWT